MIIISKHKVRTIITTISIVILIVIIKVTYFKKEKEVSMNEISKSYEALEWLKGNNNPSALSSNRFGNTLNAIEFVDKLYDLGAVKVSVGGIFDEPERIEEEGGPYATSLMVELPNNPEKREKVIELYNKEAEELGYDKVKDYEITEILEFWWD